MYIVLHVSSHSSLETILNFVDVFRISRILEDIMKEVVLHLLLVACTFIVVTWG